jgi:hypothetical protein
MAELTCHRTASAYLAINCYLYAASLLWAHLTLNGNEFCLVNTVIAFPSGYSQENFWKKRKYSAYVSRRNNFEKAELMGTLSPEIVATQKQRRLRLYLAYGMILITAGKFTLEA